jgi:hypothetical protein
MVRLTEQDKQALSIVQGEKLTKAQIRNVLLTFAQEQQHLPFPFLRYKGEALEECMYQLYLTRNGCDENCLAHGWGHEPDSVNAVANSFLCSTVWNSWNEAFDVYLETDFEDFDYCFVFYSKAVNGCPKNAIQGFFKFRYNREAK